MAVSSAASGVSRLGDGERSIPEFPLMTLGKDQLEFPIRQSL
jgi:hypothetical protein